MFSVWHLTYRILDNLSYTVYAGDHNMKKAPTPRALPLPVRNALRKLGADMRDAAEKVVKLAGQQG